MTEGAKALIKKIRDQHYSSAKKSRGKGVSAPLPEHKSMALPETKESADYVNPGPKVRRSRKSEPEVRPGVKVPVFGAENLFEVTIVGGIGLPGYPLKDGEKLAVVKLTPRA